MRSLALRPDTKLPVRKATMIFRYRLWNAGMKYRFGPRAVRAGPWFGAKCWWNRSPKPLRRYRGLGQ